MSENVNTKNFMFTKLLPHRGHAISCVCYGDWNDPKDVCIECEHCGTVLVSAEDFNDDPDAEVARLRQQLAVAQMQLNEANLRLGDAVACLKGVPGCLLDEQKRNQILEYLATADKYEPSAHIYPGDAKREDRKPLPKVVVHIERGMASAYSNISGLDISFLDMDTTDPDARDGLEQAEQELWEAVKRGDLREEEADDYA